MQVTLLINLRSKYAHTLAQFEKNTGKAHPNARIDYHDIDIIDKRQSGTGNNPLQDSMRVRTGTIRHMEVESLVSSSNINRRHGNLQDSLASVTYLSDIVQECKSVGLDIESVAQHEVAGVLWDQGEVETSIRMRQHLIDHGNFDSQPSDISLPVLLAKLVSVNLCQA